MINMETCTVTVTLHSGHREQLRGVEEGDAQQQRVRFLDWASMGGTRNTRDDWPSGAVLDLLSEVTGVVLVAPYAAIAILTVTPEVRG